MDELQKGNQLSVRLTEENRVLVPKFLQLYKRINASQLMNVALEYYIEAVLKNGMDEHTWLPRDARKEQPVLEKSKMDSKKARPSRKRV